MEKKFRAWIKKDKKYIYLLGFVSDEKSNTVRIWWDEKGTIINQSFSISEKLIIIEQYTGLKDKNDKEIYKGDKLQCFVHPEIPLYHVVEWSEKYCGWFAKNLGNDSDNYKTGDIQLWVYLKNNECEIIGTIHE